MALFYSAAESMLKERI